MADYDNVIDVDFDDDDDELDYFLDGMEEDDDDDDDILWMEDDDDDSIDSVERKRRRRRRNRSRSRAKGKGYYTRIMKGYATKKQLRSALAKVGRDVRKNRSAMSRNSSRISKLSRSTGKAVKTVRNDLDNVKQMSMFSALLGGDKKLKVVTSTGNSIPKDTVIEFKDESDTMDKLLPMLMMGGLGGGSGKGGMMDNPLMMILLLGSLDK